MDHSINVCFSTTSNFISKAVRWFTRSPISHCYITFQDQTLKRVMIMEADWIGFVLAPWDGVVPKGRELVARFKVNVPEENQLAAIHKLTFLLGAGYNYRSLAILAVRRFVRQFNNPLTSPKKVICSESVVMFLNEAGATELENPGSWTPDDVYSYVINHPEMFIRQE